MATAACHPAKADQFLRRATGLRRPTPTLMPAHCTSRAAFRFRRFNFPSFRRQPAEPPEQKRGPRPVQTVDNGPLPEYYSPLCASPAAQLPAGTPARSIFTLTAARQAQARREQPENFGDNHFWRGFSRKQAEALFACWPEPPPAAGPDIRCRRRALKWRTITWQPHRQRT